MIQIQGDVIQIMRYQVIWEQDMRQMKCVFPAYEDACQFSEQMGGTIQELDIGDTVWMDGMQIPETNRPMEKALEIAAMGEAGYKKWLEQQAAQSPENLAAENAQLKQQLTDTQLALVEVYEMMLPS